MLCNNSKLLKPFRNTYIRNIKLISQTSIFQNILYLKVKKNFPHHLYTLFMQRQRIYEFHASSILFTYESEDQADTHDESSPSRQTCLDLQAPRHDVTMIDFAHVFPSRLEKGDPVRTPLSPSHAGVVNGCGGAGDEVQHLSKNKNTYSTKTNGIQCNGNSVNGGHGSTSTNGVSKGTQVPNGGSVTANNYTSPIVSNGRTEENSVDISTPALDQHYLEGVRSLRKYFAEILEDDAQAAELESHGKQVEPAVIR